MLECVVNISEGRETAAIEAVAAVAGDALLDLHRDPDHNRSVLTLTDGHAPRAVTERAVDLFDLSNHRGAHPRIGVVDVVPYAPLPPHTIDDAIAARDSFARWAAEELGIPTFVYGPERTLPDIRSSAFRELSPDHGPDRPHRTAGAIAVGARPILVAYNLWISESPELARQIARDLRGPGVRALGLDLGGKAQVSMNLVAPTDTGPADVFDRVGDVATIERAELVGLLPEAVLEATDPSRWAELDLARTRTIEARVATRGPDRRV